jgi:formylglycine-generating enzyme required for sulfatase activity
MENARKKYALVIGNAAYIQPLKNPQNDARDMKEVLDALGFEVEMIMDGDRVKMQNGLSRLTDNLKASPDSYGFFYYAGHGVQYNGENYLIPVDADIPSESYLGDRTLPLDAVLGEMGGANNTLNIVILDACRTNPFRGWNRNSERGLAAIKTPLPGSIIMYATSANDTASDGEGRNGLFTGALLKHIKIPGVDIHEALRHTGKAVQATSGNQQVPAIYIQFFGTAYLGLTPSETTPPGMVFVKGGEFSMGSKDDKRGSAQPVHSVVLDSFYMGKYQVTQQEWVKVMNTNPSYFKGDTLPVEHISWYDAITYCNKLSLAEGHNPVYLVAGISDWAALSYSSIPTLQDSKWDAVVCDFNANGYRLPTEAEWEYAARGGIKQDSSCYSDSGWGSADKAGWYNSDGTHPVGEKAQNSLGLHDMSGNVFEWCWDWWGWYSSEAQKNPKGPSSPTSLGICRVERGGSWKSASGALYTWARNRWNPSKRENTIGFRVVRSTKA